MIARRTLLLMLPLLLPPLGGAAVRAQDAAPETVPAPRASVPAARPRRPHTASADGALDPRTVWLDPAHGGPDRGGRLAGSLDEADLTFAFASRLRAVLTERGFTVVDTRRTAGDAPPPDARAEEAGRSHAGACLLLHGSDAGHGIHLFLSALPPAPAAPPSPPGSSELRPIRAWETAQADLLPASAQLLGDLRDALETLRVPITTGHVSLPPIDSLHCPAVLVEIAPLLKKAEGGGAAGARTEVADPGYEQRIADALAAGLNTFRTRAEAQEAAEKAVAIPAEATKSLSGNAPAPSGTTPAASRTAPAASRTAPASSGAASPAARPRQ